MQTCFAISVFFFFPANFFRGVVIIIANISWKMEMMKMMKFQQLWKALIFFLFLAHNTVIL